MPSQKPTAISSNPHLPGGSKVHRAPLVTPVPKSAPAPKTGSSKGRIGATAHRTTTAQGKKVPQYK